MKVDVELEPFTPLLRPTYADAHAGAISEVRMEGYEFGHTYVWQGPGFLRAVSVALACGLTFFLRAGSATNFHAFPPFGGSWYGM